MFGCGESLSGLGALGFAAEVADAGFGLRADRLRNLDELDRDALDWARSTTGPILLRISVGTEQPKTDYFLEDPVLLARQFETWLR